MMILQPVILILVGVNLIVRLRNKLKKELFMLVLTLLNEESQYACAPDNCNPDYVGFCPPDDGMCPPDLSGPACVPDV